jgi:hypothetical protein
MIGCGMPARLTRLAVLILAVAMFAYAIERILDHSIWLLHQWEWARYQHGDHWTEHPPTGFLSWNGAIWSRVAIIIVLGMGLITFFLPRREKRLREFALLSVLCILFMTYRDFIWTDY